eukprot:scaffold22191_cov128-Isochrysis_galbana.AAC.2
MTNVTMTNVTMMNVTAVLEAMEARISANSIAVGNLDAFYLLVVGNFVFFMQVKCLPLRAAAALGTSGLPVGMPSPMTVAGRCMRPSRRCSATRARLGSSCRHPPLPTQCA